MNQIRFRRVLSTCFALYLFSWLMPVSAQAQESENVMVPINQIFEGMKKGDTALVHRAFHPSAKLFSIVVDPKTKEPFLKGDAISAWLTALGTPHKEVWTEINWSPKIEIDGNFASVWAPYAFYVDKNFHHCGVDAFQLFKNAGGEWKIFHLADTRRKEGCEVPKKVSNMMK